MIDVMSSIASADATVVRPGDRLEVLFEELAELTGQRNAIDARIVEIVAEIDHDGLCGITGARSVAALVAWKTGSSPTNANTIAAVAHRLGEFPRCAARHAGRSTVAGSGRGHRRPGRRRDLMSITRSWRAAPRSPSCAPRSNSNRAPNPSRAEPGREPRSMTKTDGEESTTWRITLPHAEAATFDSAVQSHHDALIADWKRDHGIGDADGEAYPIRCRRYRTPSMPS